MVTLDFSFQCPSTWFEVASYHEGSVKVAYVFYVSLVKGLYPRSKSWEETPTGETIARKALEPSVELKLLCTRSLWIRCVFINSTVNCNWIYYLLIEYHGWIISKRMNVRKEGRTATPQQSLRRSIIYWRHMDEGLVRVSTVLVLHRKDRTCHSLRAVIIETLQMKYREGIRRIRDSPRTRALQKHLLYHAAGYRDIITWSFVSLFIINAEEELEPENFASFQRQPDNNLSSTHQQEYHLVVTTL